MRKRKKGGKEWIKKMKGEKKREKKRVKGNKQRKVSQSEEKVEKWEKSG